MLPNRLLLLNPFPVRIVLILLFVISTKTFIKCIQQQQSERIPAVRILALFSEIRNDLGIDHRLGRQVLRLAAQRAKQLNHRLEDVELIFVDEDRDCSSVNKIPGEVARLFYFEQRVCTRYTNRTTGSADSKEPNQEAAQVQCSSVNFAESTNAEADLLEAYTATDDSADVLKQQQNRSHLVSRDTTSSRSIKFTNEDEDNIHEFQSTSILYKRQIGSKSTEISPKSSTEKLRRTNRRQSIDAIIGPSCEFLVDIVARMAAYWRAPIYSVASMSSKFSMKKVFTTLTRLSPSIDHLCMFILRTMEKFSWRHLAIIVDEQQTDSRLVYDNLDQTIARMRFSIPIERRKFVFDSFRSSAPQKSIDTSSVSKTNSTNTSKGRRRKKRWIDEPKLNGGADDLCTPEAREMLLSAKRNARVFLLLLNEFRVIRRLLLCAHQLGFHNGEYTFMALNLGLNSAQLVDAIGSGTSDKKYVSSDDPNMLTSSRDGSVAGGGGGGSSGSGSKVEKNIDWYQPDDEKHNSMARKMFESLMMFSIQMPISNEFELFIEQVLEGVRQEFPGSRFEARHVGPMAIALHDSLLLAVEAHIRQFQRLLDIESTRLDFNRNRAKGEAEMKTTSESPLANLDRYSVLENQQLDSMSTSGEIYEGSQAALMWNETFYDGLMPNLHINANGDQEMDYILSDLEPELGFMRPVASYSKETRQIYFFPGSYIHWPSRLNAMTREPIQADKAPPDEPECGFNEDADHCVDRQNLYVALSIASAVAILISIGAILGFLKYRQIKYQMQLDDYWWQIEWNDLIFIQYNGESQMGSIASIGQNIMKALKSPNGSMIGSQVGSIMGSVVHHPVASTKTADQKNPVPSSKQPVPELIVTDNQQAHEAATSVKPPTNQISIIKPPQTTTTASGITSTAQVGGSMVSGAGGEGGQSSVYGGTNSMIKRGAFVILADQNSRVGTKSMFSSIVRESSLALYRDELVIVKMLNRDSIDISRELLVDLKSMRDFMSDNLAKFVGLCTQPRKLAIVYEYCSRGSLQDLLLNDNFAMDWTLKYSIIGDILNGLNYIHTTQLGFHGRLKSTNLVLDSRFTVKITDFGLQALYSQIEAKDFGDDDDDENFLDSIEGHSRSGAGDGGSQADALSQRDTLSISVSQVGYNQNRADSSSGNKSTGSGGRQGSRDPEAVRRNRAQFKNRRSARNLWTAPELLRGSREAQALGGKKADVYSLAIIFSEIYTRREPYHFGTNAKPHWSAIRADRAKYMIQKRHSSVAAAAHHARSNLGTGSHHGSDAGSVIGSAIRKGSKSVSNKLKRLSNTVAPHGDDMHDDDLESEFGNAEKLEAEEDSPVARSLASMAMKNHRRKSQASSSMRRRSSRMTNDHEDEAASKVGSQQQAAAGSTSPELIDVDEILDQIRMSVQPEPVRPYLPNFIIHDIDPKLIDLMRQCWQESNVLRPTIPKVRQQMRNITKGQTAKNYLDNLLDRLQKYANDLERILDDKSADIVSEKQKTEGILYQLVPRFVADRLKRNEPIIPQLFDCVTIYFSDIINFEKYAAILSPVDLVQLLNSLYFSFDSIIDSFDVIKIETILDIYLIAAGIKLEHQEESAEMSNEMSAGADKDGLASQEQDLATSSSGEDGEKGTKSKLRLLNKAKLIGSLKTKGKEDFSQSQQQIQNDAANNMMITDDLKAQYTRGSAEQIARMALSIRDMITSFRFSPNSSPGAPPINLNIRMGIHSGRVCTGIVGVKRPKFCLIGDTVNVASRMHTNSKANKIQISSNTRQLLELVSGFDIQTRGKIEVKGKGQMDTFWLEYAR